MGENITLSVSMVVQVGLSIAGLCLEMGAYLPDKNDYALTQRETQSCLALF
jgi:hypothetical protein